MNLRESKKKKQARLKPQLPFPIVLNGTHEWPMYTAHLTDVGSCIIQPEEIDAIHSMGFFGKGSLSRSYPSFGRSKYGAPPVVRNRQWLRRQKWLKEVKELKSTSAPNDKDTEMVVQCESINISDDEKQDISDNMVHVSSNLFDNMSKQDNENTTKDMDIEIISDFTEEDDICEIVNRDSDKQDNIKGLPDNKNCQKLNESIEEDLNESIEEICNLDYYDFENNDDCVTGSNNTYGKLLVLTDSDSESENYLENIKPRIANEGFPVREALHLTFEETFFLLFGLGCLQLIHFDGSLLNIDNAWLYFCNERVDFLQKYVIYHYYRSKGWVVKPGIKYGGDFLLYKEGPPFYHASYIVIIEVVDADSLIVEPTMSIRSMMWNKLFGLGRLSETAAKEILFAQVLWPSSVPKDISKTSPEILSEFTVRELTWHRWDPKRHRNDVLIEEEDEESC